MTVVTHALDVKGLERNAGEDLSDERTEREGRGEADRRDGGSVMWKCDKCGHETPTGVEHFCDARPLPDFPAGALEDINTALAELEYIGLMGIDSIEKAVKRAKQLLMDLRAPARPAAAGLTLTDEEREECEIAGHDAASDARKRYQIVMTNQYVECECVGLAAAIRHAESILSSRATGAEVEIQAAPSHDETSRDVDAWLVEFQKGADTPVTATMIHLLHVGYAMGWKKCARRHATIRRGGGE